MTEPAPAAGWYADPQNAQLQRYWDGSTWTNQTQPLNPALPAAPTGTSTAMPTVRGAVPGQLNSATSVSYKGGWPGLFTGENQAKALDRAMRDLNMRGHRVAAAVIDRWSFWKRLGMGLLAILSLGFYVRSPNVILITEPLT